MHTRMNIVRSIVSLALLVTLGYSQCTGGMFAMPIALAANFDLPQESAEEVGSLMSKNVTACFDDLMSHALEKYHEEGDHIEQEHEGNCGDGAPCMRQTQQVLTVTKATSITQGDDTVAIQDNVYSSGEITSVEDPVPRARAGPLYAFAKTAAHILVKIE